MAQYHKSKAPLWAGWPTFQVGFFSVTLTGISLENTRHCYMSLSRYYLDIKIYEMYCFKSIGDVEMERRDSGFSGHKKVCETSIEPYWESTTIINKAGAVRRSLQLFDV